MLDMQMWFDKTRWQKVKLGDVCEKVRMINTKSYLYGTFRYIDIGSINAENNRVNEALEIDWVEASPRARQIVQYQDTLFSTVRVNLQRIAFLTKEYEQCIASTGFCVIRANEALADRKFIFYSCLTPQFTDNLIHLQAGTAYPAVSNKMVFGQEILLPPLDEQRRIADMLSKIEDAIAQTEQQAQALLAYRKGLINQIFQEHGSFGGVVQPDDIELVKFEHF